MIVPVLKPADVISDQGYLINAFYLCLSLIINAYCYISLSLLFQQPKIVYFKMFLFLNSLVALM